MILPTKRLILRPTVAADAPALFTILGDAEAMAHWDRGPLPRLATVEAQLADELAAMASGGFFTWTVLEGDDAIGSIDLRETGASSADLGFAFRRASWGRGLAHEALAAVIAQAFTAREQLTARIQTDNRRAIRLVEGLSFQEAGALPDVLRGGKPRARALYRLDRSAMKKGA